MGQIDSIKNDIINFSLKLKEIIQDIKHLHGTKEDLNDLSKDGRNKISEIQSCLEKFRLLCYEENNPDVKNRLTQEATKMSEELSSTVGILKKAIIECSLNIEKSDRKALLGGNEETLVVHRKKREKEELVKMSTDVTDRLLSLSRTLADTTQQSSDTLGSLVTSSGVVDGTRGELDSQSSVISQSGKLLAKYGRREQTDKFLIIIATAFFFGCVGFVLQHRLF